MRLDPHLNFNGNCEAAFKFYEQVLGAKLQFKMTHGESPMAEQVSADWRDKIIHATLALGDRIVMGSDAPPGRYEPARGIQLSLNFSSPEEAERVFHALAENGRIQMPLQQTFWSPRFGMLVDQFGIPWMINCEQPA